MRIFIAIEMPEKIKERLREIQEEFKDSGKITFAKDFHLTLRFLGEISEMKLERIKNRLNGLSFKEFKLNLNEFGVFPSRDFIRILWVGVSPERKVKELQVRVDERLRDMFGVGQDFRGHVTLGRVKFIKDKKEFLDKFDKLKIKEEFNVENIKLFESVLGEKGYEHKVLEVYNE